MEIIIYEGLIKKVAEGESGTPCFFPESGIKCVWLNLPFRRVLVDVIPDGYDCFYLLAHPSIEWLGMLTYENYLNLEIGDRYEGEVVVKQEVPTVDCGGGRGGEDTDLGGGNDVCLDF